MATAIENTIPCDRCNTQIDLREWSVHVRNCVGSKNNQPKNEERRTVDDRSNNERIKCEYCFAQISRNDWKSHSKMCGEQNADENRNFVNGTHDDSVEATIPCEYCFAQINIHELERHTRQCANNQRSQPKPPPTPQIDESVLIPCEYCQKPIVSHDWALHTTQCANNQRSQPRPSPTPQIDESVLIPCEYCQKPIVSHDWAMHTTQCANNQRPNNNKIENTGPILIPCEYCNTPVDANEWQRHTDKCAKEEKKRLADMAKRISKAKEPPTDVIIPCDFCGQFFSIDKINAHERKCQFQQTATPDRPNTPNDPIGAVNTNFPEHWDASAPRNLTRYVLDPGSEEYRFVADNFHKTLPTNQITQIERIQNRRWYRQYDAHKDDFIERYGDSTEQWLFHGCRKADSAEAIIRDCFNRSHAVNCAVGQGIYFATQSAISLGYTSPDARGLRHMFMARVLVGKTTRGDRSTRVCPPGYDTTGGRDVFVTYHDAQAYAQYLIVFR